jgi:hypothetical protein
LDRIYYWEKARKYYNFHIHIIFTNICQCSLNYTLYVELTVICISVALNT